MADLLVKILKTVARCGVVGRNGTVKQPRHGNQTGMAIMVLTCLRAKGDHLSTTVTLEPFKHKN